MEYLIALALDLSTVVLLVLSAPEEVLKAIVAEDLGRVGRLWISDSVSDVSSSVNSALAVTGSFHFGHDCGSPVSGVLLCRGFQLAFLSDPRVSQR